MGRVRFVFDWHEAIVFFIGIFAAALIIGGYFLPWYRVEAEGGTLPCKLIRLRHWREDTLDYDGCLPDTYFDWNEDCDRDFCKREEAVHIATLVTALFGGGLFGISFILTVFMLFWVNFFTRSIFNGVLAVVGVMFMFIGVVTYGAGLNLAIRRDEAEQRQQLDPTVPDDATCLNPGPCESFIGSGVDGNGSNASWGPYYGFDLFIPGAVLALVWSILLFVCRLDDRREDD